MSTGLSARIFIVEDEALIAMEIEARLVNMGYLVVGTAASGEVALVEIAKTKPDLVLMDIRLAGKLDGIDTAMALLGADAPVVVFLSAYVDEEILRRMVDAEPYGYLVKPFAPRELHATLQAALYRSRLDRTLKGLNARLDAEVRERTAQLAANEARLKEAQRIARIGDWTVEYPEGRADWSDGIYEIFGYDRTRPAATPVEYLRDVVHPDDVQIVRERLESGSRTGLPRSVEHRFRRPDGTIGWVLLEGRSVFDEAGNLVRTRGVVQDITERKTNEIALADLNATLERRVEQRAAALAESELRLHALFEQNAVGICETDTMTGRAIRVNGKFAEIAGYPVEELIGIRYASITHPDDIDGDIEFIKRLRHGDSGEFNREKRLIRKDGTTVWINSVISPLWSPGQTPSTHISVVSDVTARKRLDLAMRAISSELMTLDGMEYVEAAARKLGEVLRADIVFVTRFDRATPNQFETLVLIEDGQVVPNRTYDLAGKPCADVLGGGPSVVRNDSAKHYPADTFMAQKGIEAYGAVPLAETSGRIIGHIGIMRRRPFRTLEMISTILNMFSVAVSAALVHERSRREYRDLFEFAPDGLVLSDQDGRIVLVNQQVEAIFGWARSDLVGRSLEVLIPQNLRHAHVGLRAGFIKSPKRRRMAVERGTLLAQRKDGSVIPVEIDLAPVETDDGIMIAAAVRDITLRKRLEDQLAQSTKMEAMGKLTGGMAHDFNNYLGVIIGNLDLLVETDHVTAEQTELIASALSGAERSAELTRSLLAFSRQQPLDPRVTDINARIKGVTGLLRRTLGEDIALKTALGADLWRARIDGAQLDSCIVNLANNARDAMPRGGTLLIATRNADLDEEYVHAHAGSAQGEFVLVEVSDTGQGMPPDVVSRVFEPFFTTKQPGHGTGLGLSMVYGFVKQSGGYINIASEPGEGTTIRIYLPRAKSNDARTETTSDMADGSTIQASETILVVEDNEDVRDTTVAQLSSLGYRVIQAENAQSALRILEAGEPGIDLLFTDVVMPGPLDGFALAAVAAERRPGIKILMTSGFSGDARQGSDVPPGGLALLNKPYRRVDLAQAVRSALGGRDRESASS